MSAAFEARHAQHKAEEARYFAEYQAEREVFEVDCRCRWKVENKRRVFSWEKARKEPWYDALFEVTKSRIEVILANKDEAGKKAHEELRVLADASPLPVADEPILFRKVTGWSYGSQGYGANGYAKSACEMDLAKAVHHGLAAEVRLMEVHPRGSGPFSQEYHDYGTFVGTTEVGLLMLEHRSEVPLRDLVMGCWRRGSNPRVHMPFLPHGYEESAGIDYFGRDLRKPVVEDAPSVVPDDECFVDAPENEIIVAPIRPPSRPSFGASV